MDTSPRIREAVKIIIERMKTNPEEFELHGRFAWAAKVDINNCGFTKAEARALEIAQRDWKYRKFHNAVLESMLDDTAHWANTLDTRLSTTSAAQITHSLATQLMQVQGNSLKPSK